MDLALLVSFLCLVLLVANRAERYPTVRPALFALLGFINAGIVVFYGILPISQLAPKATDAQHQTVITGFILAIVLAFIATGLLLESVRRRVARFFKPLSAEGGFNPASTAHMIALIFCVYFLGDNILEYVIQGGLSGLAQKYIPVTVVDLLIQMAAFVSVAFIGAGLFTRRSLADVIARLGLRWPTIRELWIGAGMSLALIGFMFFVSAIWFSFVSDNTIKQQSQLSDLISQGVTTMTFALLMAGTAAIGEEIAFRGALQPVFGLWPTAIFFALTHIQYTLTPAALIIVGVGLGLGWVRQRYNTTTAIVAHFLYDFTLLMLPLVYNLQVSGALRS